MLCVETEPVNRPAGYAEAVTAYLADKGYKNATGQIGRNICAFFNMLDYSPCVPTIQITY